MPRPAAPLLLAVIVDGPAAVPIATAAAHLATSRGGHLVLTPLVPGVAASDGVATIARVRPLLDRMGTAYAVEPLPLPRAVRRPASVPGALARLIRRVGAATVLLPDPVPAALYGLRVPGDCEVVAVPAGRIPAAAVPLLTPDGRRRLEDEAARLRDVALPALGRVLIESRRDLNLDEDYDRLRRRLAALDAVLAAARPVPPPADPGTAGLGARVTLERTDGDSVTVRLTDPAEASLDAERISARSPLAVALSGRRTGETVLVEAPAGRWAARIIAVDYDLTPAPRA